MAKVPKWYVLRTFSGHEKKVKRYIKTEIERLGMQDRLMDVLIPTETIFEMRSGKKRTRQKTFFPGYILIKAVMDNALKHVVTGLPSVINFLGSGDVATPLRPDEVDRILMRVEDARDSGEKPEIPYSVGDAIKVVDGPFNNFTGFVDEVYPDKMKVRVLVSIFGRKTPLELDYLQVEQEE